MRKVCLLVLFLITLCAGALAEDNVDKVLDGMDLTQLEQAAPEMDVHGMIRSLARGESVLDVDELPAMAKDALLEELRAARDLLAALVAPVILSAVFRHVAGGGRASQAVGQVCYLVCAIALVRRFFAMSAQAGALIGRIAALSDAVFPIITTLLTLMGAGNAAGLTTPMAALAGNLFADVLQGVLLKLCMVAAVVAAVGNLSPGLRLGKLLAVLKSLVNWATGILMTAFLGIVAMKNLLAGGYDSAAVRTARYAVDNLLPVIGGEVANTMDALVSSVLLVKNAAGVTGIVLLLSMCARPILGLFAMMMALRLASAAIEPVADEPLVRLTDGFSQVAGMLLVLCAAAAVVLILMLSGALVAGGGVVR